MSTQSTHRSGSRFCLPIASFFLCFVLTSCKSYEPVKVDGGAKRTILLLAGAEECVSIPQATYAHDGDELIFFSPSAAARVTGLSGRPSTGVDRTGGRPSGIPLTPDESLDLEKGIVGSVRINDGAKGTYRLNVECGGFPDDPPKIVVW